MRPAVRREIAGHLQVAYGISERRACQAIGFGRSSQRHRKRADPQVALRMRLKELRPQREHTSAGGRRRGAASAIRRAIQVRTFAD